MFPCFFAAVFVPLRVRGGQAASEITTWLFAFAFLHVMSSVVRSLKHTDSMHFSDLATSYLVARSVSG